MFSFLFLLPVLCVGRSFANPWSVGKDFSFSSLGVRSTDDIDSSAAAELNSSFDSTNSISADATSWASGSPSSFQWNEAISAQIPSANTDPDLSPVVADSETSGTPDSQKNGCRAQVRGKFRIRDYITNNQEIGEGRQFCSPADTPTHGGKPLNLIAPESGVQPPTDTDQSPKNQPQKKVQQEKDKMSDENKQNELRAKNAALPYEDQNKCRNTPYRIRLDCDGPLGEARVSVFGVDYKEIWNCYPGMYARRQDLCLQGLKSFS